jgi:hypothetical protein
MKAAAAAARAQPIQVPGAPAPAVREAVSAPFASLSAIPARPQRACAACDEEGRVLPRLEVGPAGDRFEREADAIADHVMAMREAGFAGAAPLAPQRRCAACAVEDEEKPRRAAAPEAPGTALTAGAAELTQGGALLPEATRRFYEPRLGRDLSGVRLHRGGRASELNGSIAARAFTYRDHIWLGPGEGSGPSFTMAHELAHVLQQTAPGPVGPRARRGDASPAGAFVQRASCAPGNRTFFAPKGADEPTPFHDMAVQHATGLTTNLRGEVRVPNATRTGFIADPGRFGFADLVEADNASVVGMGLEKIAGAASAPPPGTPLAAGETGTPSGTPAPPAQAAPPAPWFEVDTPQGRMRPTNLEFWAKKPHFKDGKRYTGLATNTLYDRVSAPRWNHAADDFLRDAAGAPGSLQIGDMKFAGHKDKAAEAESQVGFYIAGFNLVRDAYNGMAKQRSAGVLPDWKLTVGTTGSGTKPTKWTVAQDGLTLVIGKWVRRAIVLPGQTDMKIERCDGSGEYPGKLYYRNSPASPALWEYIFWPNKDMREFDAKERKLLSPLNTAAASLQSELLATPAGEKVAKLPLATPDRAGAARAGPGRAKARPKPLPAEDPFARDYAGWKTRQQTLTRDFTVFEGRPEGKGALGALLHDIALRNTLEGTGGRAPDGGRTPDLGGKRLEQDIREVAALYRMSGRSGRILGLLRRAFGTTFIKAIRLYEKLRERFAEFLRSKGTRGRGRGLGKAVLKVAGAIFGAIFHQLLPAVSHVLLECIEQGISRMLKTLLEKEVEEIFGDRIEKVEAELEEIHREVETAIAQVVENVNAAFGGHFEEVMRIWETVGTLLSIAKTAFDAARVAVCAVGGLETVGISCIIAGVDFLLSLIGLSPFEALASSLLGTCMAQEMIAEHILTLSEIQAIPRFIAEKILETLRPALPKDLRPILCDKIAESAPLPEISEITCGKGGSIHGGEADASWRPPPEAPPELLNRPPTPEEIAKGGRLPRPKPPARPAKPRPPPPAGGGEPPPPPAPQPPAAAPPPAGGGSVDKATGGEPEHRVEEGTITPGPSTRQVSVNLAILLTPGMGFAYGEQKREVYHKVFLQGTDSEGTAYGPDEVLVRVLEVRKTDQGDRVTFSPYKDYLLISGDARLALKKGKLYQGALRKVSP